MATARINHKTVTLTLEQKARRLEVIDIQEPGVLAVRSGSDQDTAYAVKHNGRVSTHCPCGTYGARCSHRLAVNWKLESDRRAAYHETFDPCGLSLNIW